MQGVFVFASGPLLVSASWFSFGAPPHFPLSPCGLGSPEKQTLSWRFSCSKYIGSVKVKIRGGVQEVEIGQRELNCEVVAVKASDDPRSSGAGITLRCPKLRQGHWGSDLIHPTSITE